MNLIDWKLEVLQIDNFGDVIKSFLERGSILPYDEGLKPGQICFKGLISNGQEKRTFAIRLDKGITLETFFNAMGALRESMAVSISQNRNVDAGVHDRI